MSANAHSSAMSPLDLAMWGAGVVLPPTDSDQLCVDGYKATPPPITPAEVSATAYALHEAGATEQQVDAVCIALMSMANLG